MVRKNARTDFEFRPSIFAATIFGNCDSVAGILGVVAGTLGDKFVVVDTSEAVVVELPEAGREEYDIESYNSLGYEL